MRALRGLPSGAADTVVHNQSIPKPEVMSPSRGGSRASTSGRTGRPRQTSIVTSALRSVRRKPIPNRAKPTTAMFLNPCSLASDFSQRAVNRSKVIDGEPESSGLDEDAMDGVARDKARNAHINLPEKFSRDERPTGHPRLIFDSRCNDTTPIGTGQ